MQPEIANNILAPGRSLRLRVRMDEPAQAISE